MRKILLTIGALTIVAAVAEAPSAFKSRQIMWPPCCAAPIATASPIPEPAPITAIVFPSNLNMSGYMILAGEVILAR